MMRVLLISPFLPYSQVRHAGGEFVYKLVTRLSTECQVSLICQVRPEEKQAVEELRPHCHILETVPAYKPFWGRVRYAPMLLTHPLPVVEGASQQMVAAIRRVLSRARFDVAHIEFTHMARFVRLVTESRTILDQQDVISIPAYRRYQLARAGVARLFWWFEWRKRQRFESTAYQLFDRVLVRSRIDRDAVLSVSPSTNVAIVPHGCPDELFDIPIRPGPGKRILYVGAMHRAENQEAILYFYNRVYPTIRRRLPDVHLDIVGSAPPDRVRRLATDASVTVTGFVPALRPYYEQSSVCIAPLRIGGGIIVKVLNAMAAGRPVVSTSIGNEGVAAAPGREICVADTPELFAQQTVRLLTDVELWKGIACRARGFVRDRYSWHTITDRMLDIYKELAQ